MLINGIPSFFTSGPRAFSGQENTFSASAPTASKTTSSHRQEGAGRFTPQNDAASNHYQREHAYSRYPSNNFFSGSSSEPYSLGRGFSASSTFFQDIFANRNHANVLKQAFSQFEQLFKHAMSEFLGQTLPHANLNSNFFSSLIYLAAAFSQYSKQDNGHGSHPSFTPQADSASGSQPSYTSSNHFNAGNANAHANGAKSNASSSAGKPESFMSEEEQLARAKAQEKKLARNELCAELNLPSNASDRDLKVAYRKMALKCHPDKHTGGHRGLEPSEAEKLELGEKFKKISALFTKIKD